MKKIYCQNCKCSEMHSREPTSHWVHAGLTLLLGFWVVVWVWRYAVKGWACTKCNTVSK